MEKQRKKKQGRSDNNQSERFKIKVIEEVLSGKRTKEEARRYYGIKGKSAILEWTRYYSGEKGYGYGGKVMSNNEKPNNKLIEEQARRITELEEALRVERLRVTLSNKMIDIAESYFEIEIRKKSGVKQSKK